MKDDNLEKSSAVFPSAWQSDDFQSKKEACFKVTESCCSMVIVCDQSELFCYELTTHEQYQILLVRRFLIISLFC